MNAAGPAGRQPGSVSKAESARETVTAAIDVLIEQLEAGESDQLRQYLRTMGRFHAYSFSNLMLIVSQRPDASRVAGYRAWQAMGRQVIKGEKGIVIMAPMRFKGREPDPGSDDDPQSFVRFRAVHVFDIGQTHGDELPEFARVCGDPGSSLASLEAAIRGTRIGLETVPSLGGADGVSTGGEIRVVESLSDAERFSVLAHEWAHELLHQGEEERPSKTVRETEAEAVAFVVSTFAGLETGSASSDYIRLYRGDRDTLIASMERIQRTSHRIIEMIEERANYRNQARDSGGLQAAEEMMKAAVDRRQR